MENSPTNQWKVLLQNSLLLTRAIIVQLNWLSCCGIAYTYENPFLHENKQYRWKCCTFVSWGHISIAISMERYVLCYHNKMMFAELSSTSVVLIALLTQPHHITRRVPLAYSNIPVHHTHIVEAAIATHWLLPVIRDFTLCLRAFWAA